MFHKEEIKIRTSDCDSQMYLQPSALLDMFQECAGRHSVLYGLDTPTLLDRQKVTWVLSGMAITIDDNPKWPENIQIESWLKSLKGFKAFRDYSIFNSSGKKIIDGASIWALIDIKTRRPIPMKTLNHEMEMSPNRDAIENIIPGKLEHINHLDENSFNEKTIFVSQSDIDINDHVSNIVYIKWMFSYVENSFLDLNDLKALNISYSGEACLNDELIYKCQIKDGKGYHSFINKKSNKDLCTIITTWKIKE